MNLFWASAGLLCLGLGIVHSVMGEVLIFSRLRAIPGRQTNHGLSPRHIAVLWSAWHLITLLGFGIGASLLSLAQRALPADRLLTASTILSLTFLVSAVFWIYGTKAKHPAWLVFLVISALIWWGKEV
jgi:hypothetical protein